MAQEAVWRLKRVADPLAGSAGSFRKHWAVSEPGGRGGIRTRQVRDPNRGPPPCRAVSQAIVESNPDPRTRRIHTPLQKIHVIEPFVAGVGFVHNEDGRKSKLRNLSIREYREEKARLAG